MQPAMRIRRTLEPFRVDLPQQSSEIPAIPEDVTELDESGLMRLYAKLAAWCEYADQILPEAAELEKRAELGVERAVAAQTVGSTLKTVSAKRAQASLDLDVQRVQESVVTAYRIRKDAENAVRLVERRLSLVSREITRRSSAARGRSM